MNIAVKMDITVARTLSGESLCATKAVARMTAADGRLVQHATGLVRISAQARQQMAATFGLPGAHVQVCSTLPRRVRELIETRNQPIENL